MRRSGRLTSFSIEGRDFVLKMQGVEGVFVGHYGNDCSIWSLLEISQKLHPVRQHPHAIGGEVSANSVH